jgi:hypothetical protein
MSGTGVSSDYDVIVLGGRPGRALRGVTSWSPITPTPGRSASWPARATTCCAAAVGSPGQAW